MKAQQLKNAILQYAMQGKLVEQIEDEGTAEELYQKIQEKKEKLFQEGKLKKPKKLPEITEDETPFNIPKEWKWVNLGAICQVVTGRLDANAQDENGKYAFFTCGVEVFKTLTYAFDCDAVLLGGNNASGDYKIHRYSGKFNAYQRVYVISGVNKETLDFIYYVIKYWLPYLKKNSQGTTTRFIKLSQVNGMFIPLPPLAEQKRIVEKIEELFEKVDQYDVLEQEMTALNNSFPNDMEKSILQYAMKGKLVEQDPNDEPANMLLERIKAEKEQLIKDKVIKKEKPLPPIAEDEIPFEIPESWEWVRLGDIVLKNIGGGTPSKSNPKYWNGEIPWASVKDIQSNELTHTIDSITQLGLENSSANLIEKDNVIVCTRMGLGKIAINKIDTAINQDLRGLYFLNKTTNEYFLHFFHTLKFVGKGATVKGISIQELNNTLVPLPPLDEQKRIVEKIQEVLKLTKKLKNTINQQ